MTTPPAASRLLDPLRSLLPFVASLLALLAAMLPLAAACAQDAQPTPAQTRATAPTAVAPPAMPPVAAVRQAKNLAIITVHGEIDSNGFLYSTINRRIQAAADAGADCIVFDIDSPGGDVVMTLAICTAIKNSPVANTIAWVNPKAYSGGALIALACRELVTNDPATLGDAMPITFGPQGIKAIEREELRKLLPPLVAEMIDSARRYNKTFGGYIRDEYLLQAIVANDVKLWWVRNKDTGQLMAIDSDEFEMLFPGVTPGGRPRLAGGSIRMSTSVLPPPTAPGFPASDKLGAAAAGTAKALNDKGTVSSIRPTLTKADVDHWENLGCITDGTVAATFNADDLLFYNISANPTVVANGQTDLLPIRSESDMRQFVGATNVVRYDIVWSEHLVSFMNNMIVKGVLIVIFLVALFVEMSHPGVILPGVIALCALIALLAPPLLIGMAAWWEVAAILAGLLLLGLEAFVIPGFGVTGILGVLLLFGGLVATFIPGGNVFPDTPTGRTDLLYGITTVVLSLFTAGAAIWGIAKHFGSIPMLNRLVLKSTLPDEDGDPMLAAMDADLGLGLRIGDLGTTVTPMRPAGRVDVRDRVVDAVAELGFIGAGVPVRVTSVDGMRIGVEAIPAPAPGVA